LPDLGEWLPANVASRPRHGDAWLNVAARRNRAITARTIAREGCLVDHPLAFGREIGQWPAVERLDLLLGGPHANAAVGAVVTAGDVEIDQRRQTADSGQSAH